MKIKKTLNILLLLFFVLLATSCFDRTGPMQDTRGILPEGNYAGYVIAGEGKYEAAYCGRIGCTYEKSTYDINDDEEIELSIYYGFIMDDLINLLNTQNVTNFNYRISIFFQKYHYYFILKEETMNIEDTELLDKYKCVKEIYEHQINGSGVEGYIYKYSYATNGFLQYVLDKDKLFECDQENNFDTFNIDFYLDYDCDGVYETFLSNLWFKIFIYDNTIELEGIKYDSME